MSTNKSFSNKSSRQLLTVSEHPPAFAGFLFSLYSLPSAAANVSAFSGRNPSVCFPTAHSSSVSITLLPAPTTRSRLFPSSYCPLCPLPFYSYPLLPAPCPLPFSSCPSATHGSSPSQKAALPSPSQKTPSQTVQPPPKRLIPLFCPQHSLKTKIAIEF